MAECLVHQCVPFHVFHEIGVYSDVQGVTVRKVLASHGKTTPVHVRPAWYF